MSSEATTTGRKEEDEKGEGEASLKLGFCRKEKRKVLKKLKRKQIRKEIALKQREEEEARLNDEEEQRRLLLKEQEDREIMERQRKEFEERERLWMERAAKLAQEEEEKEACRRRLLEEESPKNQDENDELKDDDDWEYIEEGPAEIIWQGNEIIVKNRRVKVAKKSAEQQACNEDANRPTSNPLPPQSEAYSSYRNTSVSSHEVFESVSQQNPNFGTEQDKAHCPFHIKTGACRFGVRCSRAHFYPDKSCTLLMKNMYNGPGLTWEQDEGLEKFSSRLGWRSRFPSFGMGCSYNHLFVVASILELKYSFDVAFTSNVLNLQYTDEEIDHSYEEFYEDVHTEFLKFGEIVNFKVCKNGSSHLRGNVYVHYKYMESAILAYDTMNARYFAGKQISCEYVGVTRWRVAICGEYMKSRLKTCSRGTACNFIHCFRNPGGDYEWADWDNPPPKHWVLKMAALFGPSDEIGYDKQPTEDHWGLSRNSKKKSEKHERSRSRRSLSRDFDSLRSSSSGDDSSGKRDRRSTPQWKKHSADGKKMDHVDEHGRFEEKLDFEDDRYRDKNRHHDHGIVGFSTKNADQYYGRSRLNSNRRSRGRDHRDSYDVKKEYYDSDSHRSRERRRKSHEYCSGPKFSETTDISDRWETGTDLPDECKRSMSSENDHNESSRRHKGTESSSRSRSSHRSHSKHRKEAGDPSIDDLHSRECHKHHHRKHKSEGSYKKYRRPSNEDSNECLSSENSREISDIEGTEGCDSLKHKSGSQHSRKHRNSNSTQEHSERSRGHTRRKHEKIDNVNNTPAKRSRSRSPVQSVSQSSGRYHGNHHS